ncbi:MAG TPA: cation transporter, partial [Spirochaetota bacterium]|nr:cation transporter [Spirochaetota bacterium]
MHHHDHGHVHGRVGAPVSRSAKFLALIVFNAVITIAEFVGGVLSGSLALISDAGHNLSDVLALMLGYAGERVSER